MPQFLIIGEDGTDEDALPRRMAARPDHLQKAAQLKASGNFIIGGAILNDADNMAASVMIMEFDSEDDVKKWLDEEPYVNGKVWQKVTVKRFRVAQV